MDTNAKAAEAARTILASVSTQQSRTAKVTALPHPEIELGDFIEIRDPGRGGTLRGEVVEHVVFDGCNSVDESRPNCRWGWHIVTPRGEVQARDLAETSAGHVEAAKRHLRFRRLAVRHGRVNVEGAKWDMPMSGPPPTPQRECWVGYLGNQPVCLGPVWRAPLGGVVQSAPANGLVSVKTDDGGTYTVAYDTRLTLTATQRVWIDWSTAAWSYASVRGPITHDDLIPDPPVVPPPAPGGAGFDVTRVFNPVTSGTQNTGQARLWTSQVYCGDTTVGGVLLRRSGRVDDPGHGSDQKRPLVRQPGVRPRQPANDRPALPSRTPAASLPSTRQSRSLGHGVEDVAETRLVTH